MWLGAHDAKWALTAGARPTIPPCTAVALGVRSTLREVIHMDRPTKHELDRLRDALAEALDGVRSATGDDELMAAWRNVQILGWKLNALLPAAEQHRIA